MNMINVSSYRFVSLTKEFLLDVRPRLKQRAEELQLKGTILLSLEGINLFLSGIADQLNIFKHFLDEWEEFRHLWYKESPSKKQPFTRLLVRIKKEIISMGCPAIEPEKNPAPYISPQQLHEWYQSQKEMIVLDTRNDYEVRIGGFDSAMDLNVRTFRDFPSALKKLGEDDKKKTIVTYCTGGIRCEKAAIYMKQQGFENVYQLEGGILNYFEQCGGAYYQGDCFVFDKRVAVDTQLRETVVKQCFSCRQPLQIDEQIESEICPYCQNNRNGKKLSPDTNDCHPYNAN